MINREKVQRELGLREEVKSGSKRDEKRTFRLKVYARVQNILKTINMIISKSKPLLEMIIVNIE